MAIILIFAIDPHGDLLVKSVDIQILANMRTRTRTALFAGIASLMLILTAMGAGAYTGSQLVVGSVHTTDSDFEAGTLTNMTVSNGNISLEENSSSSDNVLEGESDGTFKFIISTSGLSNYPSQGDTVTYSQNATGIANSQFWFGVQDSNNHYRVILDNYNNEVRLLKLDGGSASTLDTASLSISGTYNVTIDWQSTITIDVSQGGNVEATVSDSDSTYTSGGIGFAVNGIGGKTARWDDIESNGNTVDSFSDDAISEYSGDTGQYTVVTETTVSGTGADSGRYISDNHTVEQSEQAFVNISEITNATATVTWNTGSGTQLVQQQYTSPGNKTLTWATESASDIWVNVTVTNQSTNGEPSFTMADEGVEFTNVAPTVDNGSATPTGDLTTSTPTFEIDVSDSTFGLAQGDSVNASLYVDGNYEGSDTVTANGTASVSATISSGGDNTYHWELEDRYGGTATSQTFSISTPSEVVIREEEPPHDKITTTTGVEITVTGSNETVALRNVTDGTINLTGLPTDETYIFTLNNEDYYIREAYIESIYEQRTLFLLNKSNDATFNKATLSDRTGNFDDNPTLEVQAVINTSLYPEEPNQTGQWVTISGDRIGASQSLEVYLWKDHRYRFVVTSQDGTNTRTLGEYTAKDNGTIPIEIGTVQYKYGDADTGYEWSADIQNETTGGSITFSYNDHENLTSNVSLTIKYRNNSSVLVSQDFTSGPYGEIVYTEPISQDEYENESFIVEWSAGNDGEVISGSRAVGAQQPLDLPLDTIWMQVLYAAIALMLAFFVGAVNPALGAVTVSLWSGLAWYMGIVPAELGAGAIVLAIALSVWMMVNQSRTGVGV